MSGKKKIFGALTRAAERGARTDLPIDEASRMAWQAENDLLNPIGASRAIGRETPLFDDGRFKAAMSDNVGSSKRRSIRYLYHGDDGNPIGAIQFMTEGPRTKKAVIQNIYVAEDQRRKGIASELLARARQDYNIRHSNDLTNDGRAFAATNKARTGLPAVAGFVALPLLNEEEPVEKAEGGAVERDTIAEKIQAAIERGKPENARELATGRGMSIAGFGNKRGRAIAQEIRMNDAPLGQRSEMNSASGGIRREVGPVALDANIMGSISRGDGYSARMISPSASATVGPITGTISRDIDNVRFGDEGRRSSATRYGVGVDVPVGQGSVNLSHDVTPKYGRASTTLSGGAPIGAGSLDLYGQLDRERGQKPSVAAGAMFRVPFKEGGAVERDTIAEKIEAAISGQNYADGGSVTAPRRGRVGAAASVGRKLLNRFDKDQPALTKAQRKAERDDSREILDRALASPNLFSERLMPNTIDEVVADMDRAYPGLAAMRQRAINETYRTGDEYGFFTGARPEETQLHRGITLDSGGKAMSQEFTDRSMEFARPTQNGIAFDLHTHPNGSAMPSHGDVNVERAVADGSFSGRLRAQPFPIMSMIDSAGPYGRSSRINIADQRLANRSQYSDLLVDVTKALQSDPDLYERIQMTPAYRNAISSSFSSASGNKGSVVRNIAPMATDRTLARNNLGFTLFEAPDPVPMFNMRIGAGKRVPVNEPGSTPEVLSEIDRFIKGKLGYAEGGEVKRGPQRRIPLPNLVDMPKVRPWQDRLREDAEGASRFAGEAVGAAPDAARRALDQAAAGLRTQWSALDDEGNPTFFIGRDGVRRPGIVDDTLQLPTMVDDLTGFKFAPDFSVESAERLKALQEAVNRDMGIEDPRGAAEQFGRAFGQMVGQIPVVPISAANKVATAARLAKEASQPALTMARKVVTAPIEFFGPIVRPNFRTSYGVGTAFGGSMGLLDEALGGNPEEAEGYAEGGPVRGGRAAGAGALTRIANAIRAYHGSPHRFDRFDINKIGTGEGAQAYGHGLYFAENPAVALDYQRKLSERGINSLTDRMQRVRIDGEPVLPRFPIDADETLIDVAKGGRQDEILNYLSGKSGRWQANEADTSYPFKDYARDRRAAYEALMEEVRRGKQIDPGTGHLYTVDLHVPQERLLDWDAPFGKQSADVRGIIQDLAKRAEEPRANPARRNRSAILSGDENVPGDVLYNNIGGWKRPEETSALLRDAGIPGIRYLDGGSRGAGTGSRNYVIFDDSLIDIIDRKARGGAVRGYAGGGWALNDQDFDTYGMRAQTFGGTPYAPNSAIPSGALSPSSIGNTIGGGLSAFTPGSSYSGSDASGMSMPGGDVATGGRGTSAPGQSLSGALGVSPSTLGMGLGTLASLATGIPGLGMVGSALGTLSDVNDINSALGYAGAQPLGFGQTLSAIANNLSFGAFGTPADYAAIDNTNSMVDAARAAGEGGYSADAGYGGPAGGFGGGYGGDSPDGGVSGGRE